MMAVSDGVVIGIVLGLVFAAVSYYLHTRLTQLEKKVGYMEGILLDLKVTTEQAILSASEHPEVYPVNEYKGSEVQSESLGEESSHEHEQIEPLSRNRPPSPTPTQTQPHQEQHTQPQSSSTSTNMSVNYESMTYKELQQIARQRNISGIRNLSKAQVIEVIRSHDNGTAQPASASTSTPIALSSWKVEEEGQSTSIDHLTSIDEESGSTRLVSIQETNGGEPELTLVGSD
jgi:hypothetical protein